MVYSDIEPKFCTSYLLIKVQFEWIKWLFDLQIHGVDRHANREIKSVLQAETGSICRDCPTRWVQFNHSVQSIDRFSTDGGLFDLGLFTRETSLLVHVQVAEQLIWSREIPCEARLELLQILVNGG